MTAQGYCHWCKQKNTIPLNSHQPSFTLPDEAVQNKVGHLGHGGDGSNEIDEPLTLASQVASHRVTAMTLEEKVKDTSTSQIERWILESTQTLKPPYFLGHTFSFKNNKVVRDTMMKNHQPNGEIDIADLGLGHVPTKKRIHENEIFRKIYRFGFPTMPEICR